MMEELQCAWRIMTYRQFISSIRMLFTSDPHSLLVIEYKFLTLFVKYHTVLKYLSLSLHAIN